MSFWNFVGRLLLLRWLFGSREENNSGGGFPSVDRTDYAIRDIDAEDYIAHELRGEDYRYSSRRDYRSAYIYDDEDDALDDYAPSDGNDYTFDDFLDEQDDYDLMDDDF